MTTLIYYISYKYKVYKYEYRKYKIIIITAKWLDSRDASSPDWAAQLNVSGNLDL